MRTGLKKQAPYILMLATLLVTTYLHIWRLADFPAGISGDEAYNGLEVLLLMREPELRVFAPSNAGREALFHYLLIGPILIFGPNAFALRIIPALIGILIVPLTYRWLRDLLPASTQRNWIALLAAIFTATSLWELQLSRLGLRGVLLIPCMLAAYYFFWRGYCQKQYRWFVFSGIFLGVATHIYTASRSLPLAFVLFALYVSIFYRRQAAGRIWLIWKGLVITGIVSMVVFAPLGWYFVNYPGVFLYRSDQVSLWADFQRFHAHTGESFSRFVARTWGANLWWFGEMSTPWVQSQGLWPVLRVTPFFFWIGLIYVLFVARRHVGYVFLLISFFLGILPLFIGIATTMRVILALPATYALLAVGLHFPIEYFLRKWQSHPSSKDSQSLRGLAANSVLATVVLLVSTISALGFFQVGHWRGSPPLPTLWDHAVNQAVERVKTLVLDKRQSLLLPQVIYASPPPFYALQEDFGSPLPVEDKTVVASTGTVSIFWPVDWERWFGSAPPSFVLLSPGASDRSGYVETVGQWEPAKLEEFEALVRSQQTSAAVVDESGRPLGHIIELDREQVLNSLRSEPQNRTHLNFQDEITLLGYDVWFVSDDKLDVGLFWQAERNVWEDHYVVLQLVDRQGQVWGEKLSSIYAPTAAWFPQQLIIDHQPIKLSQKPPSGLYALKLGLIKANYADRVMRQRGEWVSASSPTGTVLPGPLIPIGLVQIGAPPHFEHTVEVSFDDRISLTGYQLEPGNGPDQFRISLNWQALQPIAKDYTVTIQLLDQNQNLVAQVDKPPLGGAYPTSVWPPNQPIQDTYDLQLPATVQGGVYQLAIGLYDLQTLERLPVSQADEVVPQADLAVVQQISID